eukprot:gene10492-14100_t
MITRRNYYSHGLMRQIDNTITKYAVSSDPSKKSLLDLSLAKNQHDRLMQILLSIGLKIDCLDSESHPDSVFIEDTAIIIKNRILITKMKEVSRRNEVITVNNYFKNLQFNVTNMNDYEIYSTTDNRSNEELLTISTKSHSNYEIYQNESKFSLGRKVQGYLDGGDVLFTGTHIIVGNTSRTNKYGIEILHKTFPEYPIIIFNLENALQIINHNNEKDGFVLHLKSFCSMCGPNHILIGGDIGLEFQKFMKNYKNDKLAYEFIHVPDREAANCLFINNVLIRRASTEFPNSQNVFENISIFKQIEIEASELAKVDGALTCCSLLYNLPT